MIIGGIDGKNPYILYLKTQYIYIQLDGVSMDDSRQLAIPIYLNQKVVFDLLAVVEQGFSQLQKVRTTSANTENAQRDVGADVGASNVFAFLSIGLKGGHSKGHKEETQMETTEDRVFTPASLFSRLRDVLIERNLLNILDQEHNIATIRHGSFIEFTALFHKNPMIEVLEGIIQIAQIADLGTSNTPKPAQPNSRNSKQRAPTVDSTSTRNQVAPLEQILKLVTDGKSIDLIAELEYSNLRGVIPVELNYLPDARPDALLYGRYTVLGKVVRIILEEDRDSINLLRGTTLGRFPEEVMDQLAESFSHVRESGLDFPNLTTRITGPAIQVIPIAIYI